MVYHKTLYVLKTLHRGRIGGGEGGAKAQEANCCSCCAVSTSQQM